MSHTNFVVSGLTAYIEQNKDLLIKNLLFGKGTRERISIQPGVKKKEHLHIFDVDPVFGSGDDCGFSAAGTATLSERLIEVAQLAVNMEICEKNLVGKYAEYLTYANAIEKPLPFEEYLVSGIIDGINRKIETLLWLGDKTNQSSDPVKKWADGFIAIAAASVTGNTGVEGVSISNGKTAYEGILQVYANMTENCLERGGEIFVSPAIFRAYMQDLVALNLYHYNPGEAELKEFYIPGTGVKVVRTAGLAGDLHILGTYAKNLYYGTDGENDEEVIDMWYSKDDRIWKVDVEFNAGAQIAFLDQCVLGTFAAAPSATTGVNAGIAAVASSSAAIATATSGLNADTKVFKTQEQA